MSEPAPIGADAAAPRRGSRTASRLRAALLRVRARGRLSAGPDVRIARGARVRVARGGSVRLGEGCVVGPCCRIEAAGGSVRLGEGCVVGPCCRIEAAGGSVQIGAGAVLGERSVIVALDRIVVGDGALVGAWAVLSDAEPAGADVETPLRGQPLAPRPIEIGDGARIGAHAALGPGSRVAAGAAVGAYAVVPTPVAPLTSP